MVKALRIVSGIIVVYCALLGILWLMSVGLAGVHGVSMYIKVGNAAPHLMGGGELASWFHLLLGIAGASILMFRPLVILVRYVKGKL